MIDWDNVKMHEVMDISLVEIDTESTHKIKAELCEYEWAPNRTKYIAEIKVIESESSLFEKGDIIKLPMVTHDKEGFLVWAPRLRKPNREFKMNALIQLLPDYELEFCKKCFQMTNHLSNKCQKCKGNVL